MPKPLRVHQPFVLLALALKDHENILMITRRMKP